MIIRPVGVKLFHTDGRANRQMNIHDEANTRFSQFCKRAEKRKSKFDPVQSA
jgi:hypothetical protein